MLFRKISTVSGSTPENLGTILVIDVQPEYLDNIYFSIPEMLTFLQEQWEKPNTDVRFLYNGSETLGMIEEEDLKSFYFEEVGHNDDYTVIFDAPYFDKGYGAFRDCMDYGFAEEEIIAFIHYMYNMDINDSRDIDWEAVEETLDPEIAEFLKSEINILTIPDLMGELEDIWGPITLIGGSTMACLKEVELALLALGKEYQVYERFTYY